MPTYDETISETIDNTDSADKILGLRNADSLSALDSANKILGLVRTDSFTATDLISKIDYGKFAADSVTISDVVIRNLCVVVNDYVWVTALQSNNWKGTETLSEIVPMLETHWLGFAKTLADAVNVVDVAVRGLGVTADDSLTMLDAPTYTSRFYRLMAEVLNVYSTASAAHVLPLTVEDSTVLADSQIASIGKVLKEYLGISESVKGNGIFPWSVVETLTAIDSILAGRGYTASIDDTLTASDALSVLFWVLRTVSDGFAAADTVTPLRTSLPLVDDRVSISQTITTKGTFANKLEDVINIRMTITLGGDTYQCWVFSPDDLYPSFYTNYGFNSFASMYGVDYGCKSDGIYKLTGTTDAGVAIERGLRINYAAMGTHLQKRLTHAFFGLTGDEPALKVITDNGEAVFYVISNKAHIAQGLSGTHWELILVGIDTLDFIEITPLVLSR